MKGSLLTRCWPVLAAYVLACYVEALCWRLFLLLEGSGIDVVVQPKALLSFGLSPILFPVKYSAFVRVRSMSEFQAVFSLDFAPFVTFVAAFIGAYLLIRSAQRRRQSGNVLRHNR